MADGDVAGGFVGAEARDLWPSRYAASQVASGVAPAHAAKAAGLGRCGASGADPAGGCDGSGRSGVIDVRIF